MQIRWYDFNDVILGMILFFYALSVPSYGITCVIATLLLYKYWKVPSNAHPCTQRAIFIAIILFGSVFMGLVIGAAIVGEDAWWWNIAIESAAWWVIGLPIMFIGSLIYYKRNSSRVSAQSNTKKCDACGIFLPFNATFCQQCGKKLI